MYQGFAFFNRAIPGLVPRHLNVVLTVDGPRLTLVNFTTDKGAPPDRRRFTFRDWRKLNHTSVISWEHCRIVVMDDLKFMINRHLMQVTEDCPAHVLELINAERERLGK